MQTEEEIKSSYPSVLNQPNQNGEDAYQSNALEAATLDPSEVYAFDAPEVQVQVQRGKNSMLSVVFQKPELKNYLAMEQSSATDTRIVDGAFIDPDDQAEKRHSANTRFFDDVVLRAFAVRRGETSPFKEFSAEDCKRWEFEPKDDVVNKFSNNSTFSLDVDDDDLGLYAHEGTMRVKQTVGDPITPSYIIYYNITPLPKQQRIDFEKGIKFKRKFEKGGMNLESEVHLIRKAMKLFKPNFQSVEGGMIGGRLFTPEAKDEFIAQIDPMFQLGVVQCVVNYYREGAGRD
jgi:hypothetical protein